MPHFEEHEKRVYEYGGAGYDPLRVDSLLVVATGNALNSLIADYNAPADGKGDVGPEAVSNNYVLRAQASLKLAAAARQAFSLPDFPACTDAAALDTLFDFLEWMEGKGSRGRPPQG